MPSEIKEYCVNYSNSSIVSGSWYSNVVDKLKLTYSVVKYLHQLQKVYCSRFMSSQAGSQCFTRQQKDNLNLDAVPLSSNLNRQLSKEVDSEIFCADQTNAYVSKLSSLSSEGDSSHRIMTFLTRDNLGCPAINRVESSIDRIVKSVGLQKGPNTFKLHSTVKNSIAMAADSILGNNHLSVGKNQSVTMINGFPYRRVAAGYRYVDFLRACFLSNSVSPSILTMDNSMSFKSEIRQTVHLDMTERDESNIQSNMDRALEILEDSKSTSVEQSELCTKLSVSENNVILIPVTNLEVDQNKATMDASSFCEPNFCETSANESNFKNVMNQFSRGSNDDVADDESAVDEDEYDSVVDQTESLNDSDSSDDFDCDSERDFEDKSIHLDTFMFLNNSQASYVNTSIRNDIPRAGNSSRSLFMCPLDLDDSDAEESNDDDDYDDDDDDDWNNPCAASPCDFELHNELPSTAGLCIARFLSCGITAEGESDKTCVSTNRSTGLINPVQISSDCRNNITDHRGRSAEDVTPLRSICGANEGFNDSDLKDEEASECTAEDGVLIEVNQRWSRFYTNEINESSPSETPVKSTSLKSVRFTSDDAVYIEVLNAVEWAEDYAAARIGPWTTCAVDRMRFKRRVQELEPKLGWVFDLGHRKNVYNLVQHSHEEQLLIQCQCTTDQLIELRHTDEGVPPMEPMHAEAQPPFVESRRTGDELSLIERRSSAVA